MALGLASTYKHMEKVLGYDANIKRVYWRYTSKYTGSGRLVEWLAGDP